GLVVRRDHPSDRRAVLVELTPAGLEAADAVLGPRIAAMASVFDDLSPSQQAGFLDALTTLLDGIRRRRIRTRRPPRAPPGTLPTRFCQELSRIPRQSMPQAGM